MTAFPGSGVDVPVDATGNPSVTIAIDPIDGAIESEITYTATDNAGATSPTGTVTVPFTSPLPVTLLSFTAAKTEVNSTLTWITAEESNSDHFEIRHSLNATRWTAAGKVNASGESHAVKNYKFVHTAPVAGLNYYRLKMIDGDETFAYRCVAMVRFEGDYDISLYPNPASSLLMIHNLGLKVINSIEIIDITGRSVLMKKDTSDSKNAFAGGIDISNLTNGAYIVRLSADDTTVITRIIVIRH